MSSTVSHTLSVVFNDGFNDIYDNYNTPRTKTVYSVDSYDGNSDSLLFNIGFTYFTLSDGTIVEVGELEEGDVLRGFSIGGLSDDESF